MKKVKVVAYTGKTYLVEYPIHGVQYCTVRANSKKEALWLVNKDRNNENIEDCGFEIIKTSKATKATLELPK